MTGFVHCDPHPGNVFVRAHPANPAQHQIVILDHGLCIEVPEQLRLQYAQFWTSMFLQDKASLRRICQQWGVKYS